MQKTRQFQKGIFFVLLNPQPNGACFAGINFDGNFNLENYSGFEFKFKAQASDIKSWKIVLKTSDSIDRFTSYQQDFEVCTYSKVSIIRPGCSRLLEFEKKVVLVI